MPRPALPPPFPATALAVAALLALRTSAPVATADAAAADRAPAAPAAAAVVTTNVTLFPVADAFVDEQNPTQNFNSAAQWPVERRTDDKERYPLLKFDTSAIPEDATVTSADLKVFLMSGSGDSPVLIKVERITLDWNQGTVTWNSRPPVQGVWGSWETDNDPGVRTFSVDTLARNWIRKSMPNHGVTLRGPDGGTYERLYRSTGATRPHLDIVYTADEPTATSSPSASATPSPTATSTDTVPATASFTPSPSSTHTPTSTLPATATFTPSPLPTDPPTATSTPTETTLPTGSATITVTLSPTPSITPPTPVSATPSQTPTITRTPSPTVSTPGPSSTPTPSDTPTYGSQTPSRTPTETATPPPPDRHILYLPLTLRSATIEPGPPTPLSVPPPNP